eukprot:1326891-Amorphochlora_amoeboformis.AAC.1
MAGPLLVVERARFQRMHHGRISDCGRARMSDTSAVNVHSVPETAGMTLDLQDRRGTPCNCVSRIPSWRLQTAIFLDLPDTQWDMPWTHASDGTSRYHANIRHVRRVIALSDRVMMSVIGFRDLGEI